MDQYIPLGNISLVLNVFIFIRQRKMTFATQWSGLPNFLVDFTIDYWLKREVEGGVWTTSPLPLLDDIKF